MAHAALLAQQEEARLRAIGAISIQRVVRGFGARKRVKTLLTNRRERRARSKAATNVQRVARGFLLRKVWKTTLLPKLEERRTTMLQRRWVLVCANATCKMQNGKWKMQNGKCKMQSKILQNFAKCKMQNANVNVETKAGRNPLTQPLAKVNAKSDPLAILDSVACKSLTHSHPSPCSFKLVSGLLPGYFVAFFFFFFFFFFSFFFFLSLSFASTCDNTERPVSKHSRWPVPVQQRSISSKPRTCT